MITGEMPLQSTVKELKGPAGMRQVGWTSQAEIRDYQAEINDSFRKAFKVASLVTEPP